MKTLALTTAALLCALLATAQSALLKERQNLLRGTWIISDERFLIVEANSNLRMLADGEIRKSGTWRLSEQADVFYILEEGKITEEVRILRLNKDEFEFESRGKPITLLKMGNRSRGDARHRPFLGRWMQRENAFFVLEDNGEAFYAEDFRQDKEKAVWRLSDNGQELFFISRKSQDTEVWKIRKITAQELVIVTPAGEEMKLYRLPSEAKKFRQRQAFLMQGAWLEVPAKSALQLQFLPQGKLKSSSGQGQDALEGTWRLSPDALFVELSLPQRGYVEHMRIEQLSKDLLLLRHKQGTLRFRKIP
jgi:hypothetical protein